MTNNSVVIDTTHGLIQFPHPTMHVKTTSQMSPKPQTVLNVDALTTPPTKTKTITGFVDHPSEWSTTGTVTLLETFTETASLLTFHSMSTVIDMKLAVRETKTTETPYLIERNTQLAEFSVVTPQQSKFIILVDTAILRVIPEGDLDLTLELNKRFKTNKTEQQSNTFWFPTPRNPGKIGDHTPIQARTLKELHELKEKEKLGTRDCRETETKFLERFDWTDTLLTESKKQAIECILVDY